MSDQPGSPQPNPAASTPTARQLRGKDARALADLAAIFDDLQFVLGCCERLLGELARGEQQDNLVLESLWVAALNSYARCFRSREHGTSLSVTDLGETGLTGDVVQWHQLLGRLRTFLLDGAANPREEFFVGVSQSAEGSSNESVEGVVITSVTRPQVDETTIRQTGRLALELSTLVDTRMKTLQESVFKAAREMTAVEFAKLEPIEIDWSVTEEPVAT
ncbi:MAG TPA: hypothetical protein VHX38_21590 [Pseudonocardiaceae bacterium]|jgi:hypothetical protein|nr:hypothetical protein [Pseudonocardiaceae bacterium]